MYIKNLCNKLFKKTNQDVILDKRGIILCEFFYENKNMFQEYFSTPTSHTNKKKFIKTIYSLLNYTYPTTCSKPTALNAMLYRGINADTKEELLTFVDSFSTGEVFFGKRASLFGTGIYLSKNYTEALKYATYNANYGVVIHCLLDKKTNIIEYSELLKTKNTLSTQLKEKYTEDFFVQYIELLDDDGLFASILGYDAIYIKEKEFVLILNRGKLFINEIEYH